LIAWIEFILETFLCSAHGVAATGEVPKSPSRPSAALHARFLHLSRSVHTSLIALGPHVALTLSPEFTKPPPATSQSSLSAAEKEMELIRKRRDILTAKAAQLAAAASASAAQITELPTPPEVRDLRLEAFRREMGMLNELAMPPDFDDYKNGALIGLQGGDALGRCHGCGIGVTGEWMRGPDGPRSLCDSCGVSGMRSAECGVQQRRVARSVVYSYSPIRFLVYSHPLIRFHFPFLFLRSQAPTIHLPDSDRQLTRLAVTLRSPVGKTEHR
jgi:hypothetical protein